MLNQPDIPPVPSETVELAALWVVIEDALIALDAGMWNTARAILRSAERTAR